MVLSTTDHGSLEKMLIEAGLSPRHVQAIMSDEKLARSAAEAVAGALSRCEKAMTALGQVGGVFEDPASGVDMTNYCLW